MGEPYREKIYKNIFLLIHLILTFSLSTFLLFSQRNSLTDLLNVNFNNKIIKNKII